MTWGSPNWNLIPAKHPCSPWTSKEFPGLWDGEDVASFLKAEKWTEVGIVNRRRAGKSFFRWTVKGKPPESDKQGPWSYVDAGQSEWNDLVSKVAWSHGTPDSLAVRPPKPGPWTSSKNMLSDDQTKAKVTGAGVAPTQPDPDTQEEARSPARPEKQVTPAGGPADTPSVTISKNDLEWLEDQGWKRVNQEGTGDCGYRSICAALSWAQNEIMLTPEESMREGAVLMQIPDPISYTPTYGPIKTMHDPRC